MERILAVQNETKAQCVRSTRDGRKITYDLQVIQQPERARACGSGAKSSADRRPVDPPPVIELRIFEGEAADKDITFSMNANYFLFATLEQARPIAQGRVQQDPGRLTVLTGTPVAGLVYLDRPSPAGYFLFPDLSVRHEGKYRLSFNLYEELKEEKDQDKLDLDDHEAGAPQAHVTHRLEVKSKPFIVYSAKKFPGLASSTFLSRLVAEQGCRVRIRRDVRIRKHDKSGKEYEVYEDGQPAEMYSSSAGGHAMGRQRSSSVGSQVSHAPSRNQSEQDLSHVYHQQVVSTAPQQISPGSYPYTPTGPPQYQQTPYQSGSGYAQPGIPQQPVQQSYPYGQQVQQPPHAVYYDYQQATQHSPAQTGPARYEPHSQSPVEYRSGPHPPTVYSYPQGPPRHVIQPPQPLYTAPVQVSTYQTELPIYHPLNYTQNPSRSVAAHKMLPAINTGLHHLNSKLLEASSPTSSGPSPSHAVPSGSSRAFGSTSTDSGSATVGKRAFGQVFDTRHVGGPMRAGARPSIGVANGHHTTLMVDPDEAGEDPALLGLRLSYKRADGRQITKAV